MNRDILHIGDEPIFNDRIVKIETHTYNLYVNTTFGYSDEYPYKTKICTRYRARVFSTSKENFQRRNEMETNPNNQNY